MKDKKKDGSHTSKHFFFAALFLLVGFFFFYLHITKENLFKKKMRSSCQGLVKRQKTILKELDYCFYVRTVIIEKMKISLKLKISISDTHCTAIITLPKGKYPHTKMFNYMTQEDNFTLFILNGQFVDAKHEEICLYNFSEQYKSPLCFFVKGFYMKPKTYEVAKTNEEFAMMKGLGQECMTKTFQCILMHYNIEKMIVCLEASGCIWDVTHKEEIVAELQNRPRQDLLEIIQKIISCKDLSFYHIDIDELTHFGAYKIGEWTKKELWTAFRRLIIKFISNFNLQLFYKRHWKFEALKQENYIEYCFMGCVIERKKNV